MGASSLVDRHAIVIRDRVPVSWLSPPTKVNILLARGDSRPWASCGHWAGDCSCGLFNPTPLANASIRGARCGHLWVIKRDGPEPPPTKCERCQQHLRSRRTLELEKPPFFY